MKNVTPSFVATPSKNWNSSKLSIFENLVESLTLLKIKGSSHYEIMINYKKMPNKN